MMPSWAARGAGMGLALMVLLDVTWPLSRVPQTAQGLAAGPRDVDNERLRRSPPQTTTAPPCRDPAVCRLSHPTELNADWADVLDAIGPLDDSLRTPCWRPAAVGAGPEYPLYASNDHALGTTAGSAGMASARGASRHHPSHPTAATPSLRCLPSVYLLGVAKCGTTDVFQRLRAHPAVRVGRWKEPQWLTRAGLGCRSLYFNDTDRTTPKTFEWYCDSFPAADIAASNALAVDGSASSFWDRGFPGQSRLERLLLPEALHALVPGARLILCIRDPVRRAWSDYVYFQRLHCTRPGARCSEAEMHIDPADFHRRVVAQIGWFRSCCAAKSQLECLYSHEMQHDAPRLALGTYAPFLRVWWRFFKPEQMFIIKLEHLESNSRGIYTDLFDNFLQLPPLRPQQMEAVLRLHRRKTGDKTVSMHPDTAALLHDFYLPFEKDLVALLTDAYASPALHGRLRWIFGNRS